MKLIKLYIDSFTGLTKDVWSIALIYLVNRSGEMVIPFMSVYLTSQLGFTKTQSGVVLFCFGLGAMIGSNIGGYLSDRIGNFKVMAISLAGMGVSLNCINFFNTFLPIASWMIVVGLFSSMFSPAAFSAVVAWGKPENQTRGYSLLRMAINLGIAIGPTIGGFVAHNAGYKWIFILDGMTCFIALFVLFRVLGHRNQRVAKKAEKKKKVRSPYSDKVLIAFLFFNLINMIAFFQILFSVPVYFKEVVQLDETLIGFFFTVNGLLVLIFEMPLVYLIEKTGIYFKSMLWGALLIGLSFACLSIFNQPLIAILLYSILIAIGEVINFPLIPSLSMRRSDESNQGLYMGTVSMMFAMAFMLAPITGLPVIEIVGFETYWFIAAALSVISGFSVWGLRKYFPTNPMS